MGNSVTPGVGNYMTDSALRLGNYVTGDKEDPGAGNAHSSLLKDGVFSLEPGHLISCLGAQLVAIGNQCVDMAVHVDAQGDSFLSDAVSPLLAKLP